MNLNKYVSGAVVGTVAGVMVGAVLGPNAGLTAAAAISRRWIRDQK